MTKWHATIGFSSLLAACSGGSATPDAGIDATPPADAAPDARPAVDCTGLVALPVTATSISGFSGSEDFAFDADGNLVSNKDGSVTKQPKTGSGTLLIGGFGDTAGTRYLSNGDLVIADVSNGTLKRIKPDGETSDILAGFSYPNGVEVDEQDFVYVAEHDAGQIRRVNPDTGEFTVIATGLTNPNGLSFSPDYRTLYVNSFGGGTVHKVTVDDSGTWAAPVLLGDIFDGEGGPCEDKAAGDFCDASFEAGVCTDSGGTLGCDTSLNGSEFFEAACNGIGSGEPCSVTISATEFPGTCQGGSCNPDQSPRKTCEGKQEGDACTAAHQDFGAFDGTCSEGFGSGISCFPGDAGGPTQRGGLDGMAVDACGNVYVTEYTVGFIWRFTPEGVREKVVTLPSFWIPNMHWGSGIGGWEEGILYVMDRDEGRLFELDLGIHEKERVYP